MLRVTSRRAVAEAPARIGDGCGNRAAGFVLDRTANPRHKPGAGFPDSRGCIAASAPNVWTACCPGHRNCHRDGSKHGGRADAAAPAGRPHRKRSRDLRGRTARERGPACGLPRGRRNQHGQRRGVHCLPSAQRLRTLRGVEPRTADNGAKPVRQHAAEHSRSAPVAKRRTSQFPVPRPSAL
jgi:hypothetical protein